MNLILDTQQRLADAGFQWVEHIFNDGKPNCYVRVTRCQSPHHFNNFECSCRDENGRQTTPELGWGRFDRMDAWYQLREYMIQKGLI